jgi:hypothetical protein
LALGIEQEQFFGGIDPLVQPLSGQKLNLQDSLVRIVQNAGCKGADHTDWNLRFKCDPQVSFLSPNVVLDVADRIPIMRLLDGPLKQRFRYLPGRV